MRFHASLRVDSSVRQSVSPSIGLYVGLSVGTYIGWYVHIFFIEKIDEKNLETSAQENNRMV